MYEPKIIESFKKAWKRAPQIISSAPARANLIGEHIDYNGGPVLPFALPFRLTVAACKGKVGSIKFLSKELGCLNTFLPFERRGDWADLARGVFWLANKLGLKIYGRYYVESDIPLGSGLSSSAAFEVALLAAIFALNKKEVDPKEIALLGQRVENEFLGVQSGIMDQMASALGKKDHLLLIDCASLDYKYIKWFKAKNSLWIIHTGVSRTLAGSEYNKRRADCEKALDIINDNSSVKYKFLSQVPINLIEELKNKLGLTLYKRAKHVISETKRVYNVVRALERKNVITVGKALFESHKSLKNNYQVSCKELDLLVKLAKTSGALGGRLVGAGFGGAAIFLVPDEKEEDFLKIEAVYRKMTKKEPMVWKVYPSDGLSVQLLKGE